MSLSCKKRDEGDHRCVQLEVTAGLQLLRQGREYREAIDAQSFTNACSLLDIYVLGHLKRK